MRNADTKIVRTCPFCNKVHSVNVISSDYRKWFCGDLVQKAFPYLNSTEREQLISGMCPACQSSIFGEEDEDWDEGEDDYNEAMAESLASTGQWW